MEFLTEVAVLIVFYIGNEIFKTKREGLTKPYFYMAIALEMIFYFAMFVQLVECVYMLVAD